jgi:hypothetical protein
MQIRRQMMWYPDLPPIYRRVAWLEGRGRQLISTRINCESGLIAKYKIAFTRTDAVQQVCAAIRNGYRIYFPYNSGNGTWSFSYGSGGVVSITGVAMDANVPYTVEAIVEDGNQRIIIDGQECYSGAIIDHVDLGQPLWLFASNNTAQSAWRFAYARIYSFSLLKSSTGELLANYIPCVRKNDGKPGMYDTVTRTFRTNATGSGEFAVPS